MNLVTNEIFGAVVGQSTAGAAVDYYGKIFTIGVLTGNTTVQQGTASTNLSSTALALQFLGTVSLRCRPLRPTSAA